MLECKLGPLLLRRLLSSLESGTGRDCAPCSPWNIFGQLPLKDELADYVDRHMCELTAMAILAS